MEMGGDVEKRKKFVLDASQTLAAEAVIALARSAATASKQTISHTMLRLIGKLALQAEKGGAVMRAGASRALKDQVESLTDEWDPRRLNPESYQDALDRMAQRRVFTLMLQRQHPCEPKRLVATSLETDTLGAPVWLAVNQLISHGGIAMLLDMLERAPAGSKVADELWPLVATPDNIRHLLREEQIDPHLLERITSRLGVDVVELLLEGLESSETRTMRRKLLDLLAKFGSDAGPMVIKRLEQDDMPWYVQRNLLTLLQMLPAIPDGFHPQKFMTHSDERVRREAMKLMLRVPKLRAQTIIAALGDRDDTMVKLAMQASLEDCPPAAVPLIVRHCERKSVSCRNSAPSACAWWVRRTIPATLTWLLKYTVSDTRFFKRQKLLGKTPGDARRPVGARERVVGREQRDGTCWTSRRSPETSRSAQRQRRGGSPVIEPIRFLNAFGKSLAAMALYAPSHPARAKSSATALEIIQKLQREEGQVKFSFLGDEVIYQNKTLKELRDWEWSERFTPRRRPAPRVHRAGERRGVRGLPVRGHGAGDPRLARPAARAGRRGEGVREHPLRGDRHPRRQRAVPHRRAPRIGDELRAR